MTPTPPIPTVVLDSSAADAPILEEALCAMELTPSSFSNLETRTAQTFLVADTRKAAEELAERVAEQLKEFWEDTLENMPKITVQEIRQEDWANNWKKNFHVFRASDRLVVKPSWEDYQAKPGEIILPINPGMCFGTGYHGTTRACLQFLDKIQQREQRPLSFTDAGTGSGILSLGAKLLGYDPILAFDLDPQCIEQSKENFDAAGVTGIELHTGALGSFTPARKADVAAANILAVVLLSQSTAVLDLVRPGGYLILSGILTEQYPSVLNTFRQLGCEELEQITLGEWTSGLYRTPCN